MKKLFFGFMILSGGSLLGMKSGKHLLPPFAETYTEIQESLSGQLVRTINIKNYERHLMVVHYRVPSEIADAWVKYAEDFNTEQERK
jgi:hypothetical protein